MSKVVHIGPSAGKIVEVTGDHVLYVDETNEPHRVDLDTSELPGGYVGVRSIAKMDGGPWVALGEVKFFFDSYEAAYDLLLNDLAMVGQKTWDCT